jgi:signal peptidase II
VADAVLRREVEAETRPRSAFRTVALIGGLILMLDQLSKLAIRSYLDLHGSIPVIQGFLDIVHVRNPGAAFSLLAGAPAWFRGPFFIAVTLGAIGVLVYAAARLGAEERILRVALGGVLGGAVGNLLDRLFYGEVIDFIDVHWRGHHWPAFNVADSSITLAVAVVVVRSLFSPRPPKGHSAGGSA